MIKLDRLINVLGGYGARLCSAPKGRATQLYAVGLYDPNDPGAEDVLLAVGVDAPEDIHTLLATTDAAVAVFRLAELREDSASVAHERGVSVVLVDPAVSWGQLAAVVYGLVLESRGTEAGRGPTDLFALADSLAESIGGPVTIENDRSVVLAYSRQREGADRARLDTILGRRVPERIRAELSDRGVFSHLAGSDEPLFVGSLEAIGFHGRAVVAVRAGRELLGSIWVEVAHPLPTDRQAALVEGARTASLHMLRMRASSDLERQIESDLVIGLLEGTVDAPEVVSRLGLHHSSYRVVAVQPQPNVEHNTSALLVFERATTGLGWTRPGRSALFANTVYTVVACGDDPAFARSWLTQLLADMPPDSAFFAGIGGPAESVQLTVSRREADECLAIADAGHSVVYDESWHQILLWRLRNAASTGRVPTRGPVADLREHDAEHGTKYAETLRGWLDCQGDLTLAGARLAVHPNTIRYRLRKMSEVTSLRLDAPEQRLAMIIALAAEPP